jgi:alkaline phosphatase D
MDRRQFLKYGSFITVSVAGAGLSACGGSSGAASSLPAASGAWKFPQSVASGDPRADSILLWTRAVPGGRQRGCRGVRRRCAIRWWSAADNSKAAGQQCALSGAVADVAAATVAVRQHRAPQADRPDAGHHYYYQFIAGDNRSNVGRFKTAPAADADVAAAVRLHDLPGLERQPLGR